MPQSLNDYMKDVQTFLRDSGQDLLDPEDIIKHVNRARREIALKTQCVRILTPITGAVIAATRSRACRFCTRGFATRL